MFYEIDIGDMDRSMETVKNLIAAGASVNHMTSDGKTPLTITLQSDSGPAWICDMASVLLDAGANPNPYKSSTDADSPLTLACRKNNAAVVEKVLMLGGNPDHIGRGEMTVLQAYILTIGI